MLNPRKDWGIVNNKTLSAFGVFILILLGCDIISYCFFRDSLFIRGFFNVGTEKNVPTLFSTINLMIAGSLLAATGNHASLNTKRIPSSYYWKILSVLFFILALDEWVSIHDVVGREVSYFISDKVANTMKWTFSYLIFCGFGFLFFLKFLYQLPKSTAFLFSLAGFLFILGAIGFELAGYLQLSYQFLYTFIEEALEMSAILLFNWTILRYLSRTYNVLHILVSKRVYMSVIGICLIDMVITWVVWLV